MAVNFDDIYTAVVGDPTYLTDAATALNTLLMTERSVYMPYKPFKFDTTIAIGLNGTRLYGDGVFANDMTTRNGNLPLISIASGLNGVKVQGLHGKRSVMATSGGNAVQTLGGQSNCDISGNQFENHWLGLYLLSGDVCKVDRNVIIGSYSHCVFGSNTNFAWDWDFDRNLLAKGGGSGIYFSPSPSAPGAPAVCPVGRMTDNEIFSLDGYGIVILGHALMRVSNVDIQGGFIGSVGRDGILLDTYEGYHSISDVKFEQIGVDTTGRSWSTPASNQGNAIALLSSNKDVSVTGVSTFNTAYNGISSQAADLNVNASRFENSGIAGVTLQRNGVATFAGEAMLTGVRSRNTNGATSQQYGAWFADGAKAHVNGVSGLRGNSVANYACAANPGSITIS